MAKQIEDTKTVDLVGNLPAKRGRPPSGNAMSASERKRKSLEAAGLRAMSVTLPVDLVEALDRYRVGKDVTYSQIIEKLLRTQLLRPR